MSVECSPTIGTTLFPPKLRTFMEEGDYDLRAKSQGGPERN